jgi:methionine-rich copper-binding protein CopC
MVKHAASVLLATILAIPVAAGAHAFLERADPPVGGHVAAAPSTLYLFYTESVVPHFSTVELLDPAGHLVRTGPLRAAHDGRELVVPLPPLAPGRYTVVWHVTSEDTHKTEGKFSFAVGG